MNIVREELSKIEGTTDSSATGTNLQILCDDSLTTVRSCSVGANAGCLGNKPPNNLPEGTNVLAGGGTAAKTIDIGICGPFTPPPLRTARTPTGARTNVGGGAVFEFGTDGNKNIANETVRAMRTRRAAFHITNDLQDKLVQGTLQSAVAIAYALPPLATKPARLAGDFVTFPATKNQPTTAAGIASVRLINPRSFAYVLELYEMSGVPTNGIFIRGPGLRRNSRTPQLTIHTVASVMVGNGTAAIRAATQECELVSASLTVCAGTVDNIDEAMISALLKGKLYIDVRTSMYPFGELRAVLNTRDGLFISGSSIIAGNNGFGTSTNGNDNGETGTRTCTQPLARNLGLSYGGAWAKAFGQMLNFNCALVLYPILRYLLRKINNFGSNDSQGGISSWIPLHRNIDFHKLIAAVIGLCTIGHVVAHYLNYGKSPDATIVRFSWLAWLTGALITISMLLIFSGGQANVKRAHYELFLNTHRAFIVFMICLLLHGPSYYIWGLVGIILYILEIVMRQYRGSHHYFVRSVKYVHPVMQIKFRPRHPDEFTFKEGQYLYLNCPYVSKNEWHPFTISSAVGDLDQGGEQGWISVHIRIIPGGWTENTLRYFCAMDGRDLNQDDLKNDLFLSLSSRDAKGQIQIGKDRGIDGKPLLLVDGPHAAPAQHYSMFDHVMMIGAGIGLTPSCSILRSVLKYKWKKGWKPPLLRFYWVVRHSEIDSFLWFLEQLIQFEKEIVADRAAGTIRNIHIFEANIYITRAPKPNECTQNPKKIPDHVLDLLLAFKTNIRSESESRGLAANPRSHTNHMRVDVGPARNLSSGNSFVNRGGVAEAGLSQAVDIGYDIERLYESMYNPCVPSKNQTTAQLRENAEMADNRLGSIWLWNGRPDWNQIFDQNKITPYVTTGIGVAFCGTPFIGKDLSKYCRIKSNPETGQVFHLLKENF
jgi:NADPH oxidase